MGQIDSPEVTTFSDDGNDFLFVWLKDHPRTLWEEHSQKVLLSSITLIS